MIVFAIIIGIELLASIILAVCLYRGGKGRKYD